MIRNLIIICLIVLTGGTATAQKYPERGSIRSGNKLYGKEDYPAAEVAYRRALEKQPASYEATFNLADALYKQKRFDEAAKLNIELATDSAHLDNAAQAYFNQGNALFQQRKLEEALEAYKSSLRLNPGDMEAKFNYAYTKKLLDKDKEKENQDKNKDQNQDQNKDQNKDQDQNKDPNDPDKNQPPQEDPNKPDQPDQQPPSGEPQPQQGGGISQEEAERILDAVQGSEDNTKKKVDEQKVKVVGRSGKNW